MQNTASRKHIRSLFVVYEADREGGYVAFISALPGCHTQGDTLEEAERNIKEAAALYLEDILAERGVLPRETRTFQGKIEITV
jgi:predicted RNase H-like HicB family nuclease